MKLLRFVVIVFFLILLAIVVGGWFLPRQFSFEREVEIQGDTIALFQYLNGFENFNRWSPWFALDPQASYRYEGPAQGVGAMMSWHSDKPEVGSGSQRITAVQAPTRIEVALSFTGQDPADSWYQLHPVPGATRLVWGFHTDLGNNPLNRYLGLFLEAWVAADYERGLQQLKTEFEADAGGGNH